MAAPTRLFSSSSVRASASPAAASHCATSMRRPTIHSPGIASSQAAGGSRGTAGSNVVADSCSVCQNV
jgi:hypothetical protein